MFPSHDQAIKKYKEEKKEELRKAKEKAVLKEMLEQFDRDRAEYDRIHAKKPYAEESDI